MTGEKPPSVARGAGISTREQRRRATGKRGEQLAVEHLGRRGFTILGRNIRTAAGEIDVIARHGGTIAFVEIKTTARKATIAAPGQRADGAETAARAVLERLGASQRRRLRGLALDWLRSQPATLRSAEQLRFDAIGVAVDEEGRLLALEHLEGAW